MLRVNDGILAYRILKYRGLSWLPAYRRDRSAKQGLSAPTDLIVCIADHFEPPASAGRHAFERVRDWVQGYREATAGILDSGGHKPMHTWFYRFDLLDEACVRELALAAWEGLGEIEFHLHHGNDDRASFRRRLHAGLELGRKYGAMLEKGCRSSFGYIAGNWALNNGGGDDRLSGCDEEISVLREEGCFGDFTFPAFGSKAQPARVNDIYYASSGPGRQAYEQGPHCTVGVTPPQDGLLMVQGPLVINRKKGEIEYAAVESFSRYKSGRIAEWIRGGVVVRGRPEWRFIKLHTHGIQSQTEYQGQAITRLYTELRDHADRNGMRVHFVTARELVNIIRAAEQGNSGDAGRYRDYALSAPPNTLIRCEAPMRMEIFDTEMLKASFAAPATTLSVRCARRVIRCRAESIHSVALRLNPRLHVVVAGNGTGSWTVDDGASRPVVFSDGSVTLDPHDVA